MPGPYFAGQQPAECGHYYPDVLRLHDERRADGKLVRVIHCHYCGQYDLPLDARTLDPQILRELKQAGRAVATHEADVAKVRQANLERLLRSNQQRPTLTLQSLIDNAIRQDADAVELEYVSDGLEVTYFRGHTGQGEIVHDQDAAAHIIDTLVTQANLDHKARGTFRHVYQGKPYEIRVKEEERFGEPAFRLTLQQPKRDR